MSLSRNVALPRQVFALVVFALFSQFAASSEVLTNGNRLVYLDESDPFYPGLNFPKLTTPQWIGEPGVDAAVILAIDDMRDIKHYEDYIRPILERLKQIDGRAHFSIMTIKVKTEDPQLQMWLKEGVSLEAHTLTHPEPLLAKGNFAAAADTYNGCIDMLREIAGNKPVAFRMPYCDSLDTPSPRFYAELFNSTNSSGRFLQIDSSVMNITTSADPILPRATVFQADGKERFRKYIPFPSFVTTIENYPYPYVIGRLCWEFPAMVPSDWEAKNIHGTNNPVTVADWKAALDTTVLKQGAFTFIFHPHNWIRPDQLVEFIDYAVTTYGKRVKFLSFAEAAERLNANLLAGQPLRATNGGDNGVRLIDLNGDGFLDVVIGNDSVQRTRIWEPKTRSWRDGSLPVKIVSQLPQTRRTGDSVRFGVIGPDHRVAMLSAGVSERSTEAFVFDGQSWKNQPDLVRGLEINGQPVSTSRGGKDAGVRLRDLDNDGQCELLVGNDTQSAMFNWSDQDKTWKAAAFKLPAGVSIVDENGVDAGMRFVDINGDGYFDLLFSNDRRFSLQLFRPKADERLFWQAGWTDEVISRNRAEGDLIPRIVRGGAHSNNGVWFHSGTMWVQNEDTAGLPDHVDRRSFQQLLRIDQTQPLTPEKSLASIKVHPGFKVELVASEPLIEDPVAFDWGADGKLWVVEMIDYPLGIDGHGQPGGRVRFLEDTDGDGRYTKSTIFLDGLNFPNGIIPWRKGVIVSSVPEIFYAEDTDGDGKADLRKTLFIGFAEGNQQHRANGFELGLDNWLYGANGDSGGSVQAIAPLIELPDGIVNEWHNRGGSVNLRGHDFRIRPTEGLFETVAGQAQFGRHRNDWGDWFGNENPTWLWHYFLPEHYLTRNPSLAVRDTKRVLANYPDSTRAFPISRTLQRFNDPAAANHVTSANSATPYRDDLFGPAFANSVFVSEPVHNLIHREILEPDGVSFTSHRASEETTSEFLASTDNWFRPTMLKTGPDGALYIADMYRQVIEHPEWIPAEMQKRLDLRAGADKGRIYRVYPADAQLRPVPRLDKLALNELVNALDSANGWQRDTAQRLLLHTKLARAAVPPLERLVVSAKRPQTRLQALAALDGISGLTAAILVKALRDEHPAVRCLALQMSEATTLRGLPARSAQFSADERELTQAILNLVKDSELKVRYQLAFTLGEWESKEAAQALVDLARTDGGSPEMMTAVLSSAEPHAAEMLRVLLAERDSAAQPGPLLGALLTSTSVARDSKAVAGAINIICQLPPGGTFQTWQFRAFIGLLDGLERLNEPLDKFVSAAGVKSAEVEGVFIGARKLAANPRAAESERIVAIGLLAPSPSRSASDTDDFGLLGQLLSPSNPTAIQEASLETLKRSRQTRAASVILANWRGFGPTFRLRALNALGSRPEWIKSLLSAMEAGKIAPGEIGSGFQQRLLSSHDESIRGRAQKLLGSTRPDRQALVRQYSAALTGSSDSGNPSKGAVLFRQNCAVCHRLRGEGSGIGPDLGAVSGKPTEVLLAAILDPNQAVESRYLGYNITLKGGRELTGIISGETSTSITVRNQGVAEEVLLRSDITELTGSGLSLMPEGLEKVLKPSDVADLVAWLRAK